MWAMGGRAQVAIGWAKDATALAEASGDPEARLQAASGMLVSAVFTGGRPDLRDLFDAGIELASSQGTTWLLAMATSFAGAALAGHDPEAAMRLVRRGEEAAQAAGNPYVLAAVAMAYGRVLGQQGATDEASARFATATARFAEIGDERLGLAARSDLGHALRRGRRFDEAMAIYRETIGGWVHLGHRAAVANQLENVAYVDIEIGSAERAARLFGAAEAIREAVDAPMAMEEGPEYDGFLARLRALLPAAALDRAWSAGRTLSLAEAVALARTAG
jgi:hypothetical protein